MNTVLDRHLHSAGTARVIARAASRIGAVRRGLYRLSLRMLKLGLWLRRAGLPTEARLALRLSRWAWRTASGRLVARSRADARGQRRKWMSRAS